MNITSPNGSFPEISRQNAYAKQTQVASEIAANEKNVPQQISAPTEYSADVPVNAPVSAAQVQALADELHLLPDIDHAKVADVMEQLNSGKFTVSNDALADAMMNFYQSGR